MSKKESKNTKAKITNEQKSNAERFKYEVAQEMGLSNRAKSLKQQAQNNGQDPERRKQTEDGKSF